MHRLSVDGGVQIVVRSLIRTLDPEVIETHVITGRPLRSEDRLEELPIVVHPMNRTGSTYRVHQRIVMVVKVAACVRRLRPDVVHLHSGTSWMAVLARVVAPRAGFVLEVHDAPGSGRHGWLTDRLEGWWCHLGRATVVCHSSSVAAEVRARWHPREDRLVMFSLAVDTERFRPAVGDERVLWREAVGVPAGVPVVLVVGRLARSKRYDRAVRAVAELVARGVEVGLVVVGEGVEGDALRALVDELGVGDRVWFTGRLVGDELAAAFRAADVVCSPSEYEGFGLTLVEAMASGLPVVAVAVGGVTDIVVDGVTGRLVPADRPEGLVDALGGYVVDPQRRLSAGHAGRERALTTFGVPQLVAHFTAVYEQAAARGEETRGVAAPESCPSHRSSGR